MFLFKCKLIIFTGWWILKITRLYGSGCDESVGGISDYWQNFSTWWILHSCTALVNLKGHKNKLRYLKNEISWLYYIEKQWLGPHFMDNISIILAISLLEISKFSWQLYMFTLNTTLSIIYLHSPPLKIKDSRLSSGFSIFFYMNNLQSIFAL